MLAVIKLILHNVSVLAHYQVIFEGKCVISGNRQLLASAINIDN